MELSILRCTLEPKKFKMVAHFMIKDRKTKSLLKITGALLLFFILFILAGSIDEKKKHFPELAYTAPVVADEDNGFSLLQDANNALVDPDELHTGSDDEEEFDVELWSEYIEKNQEALRFIDKALECERIYEGEAISFLTGTKSLFILEIAKLKKAEIRLSIHKGNHHKAVAVIEQLKLLRKKFARDNSSLINNLLARAIDKLIAESINSLIENSSTPEEYQVALNILNTYNQSSLEAQMKLAFISEYKFAESRIFKILTRALFRQHN